MPFVIYNSLTKKKEEFVPRKPGAVKMYTCGVTVYDDCHVGHARSLFIFDVLRRYLRYKGYKVTFVRNITDVDDKIINRSLAEKVSFEAIRKKYIERYYRDLNDLEIDRADFEPCATENVGAMVAHIGKLIEKGCAYEAEGDVYFSVRSFADYGRLSGQSVDEMMTAVRIEKDERKKDPLDFALWKRSKPGEPSWKSPWGGGRPGWHIECSTMSLRYLKTETLDIHAGGHDLIFPHHENEIAQAEALTGRRFANTWIHHGLLTINGQKMSKSLGNFVTIQEALKRYRPDVIKLFFLSAHYASPMDFSFEALENTKKAYEKFGEFLDKIEPLRRAGRRLSQKTAGTEEAALKRQEFGKVMDDDFNTAQAAAVLFEILNAGNRCLSAPETSGDAVALADLLVELGGVLGMHLKPPKKALEISASERVKLSGETQTTLSDPEIERLIAERREARRRKDFRRADEIRDVLKRKGVTVEDKEKSA